MITMLYVYLSHSYKIKDGFASEYTMCFSSLQLSNGVFGETNQSELAAFTSYALAFPDGFLALVDTYDVSIVFLKQPSFINYNPGIILLRNVH